MFDIGWSELLVIAVVAIVVVGPKELPRMMRTFGQYAGKLRSMAADFQRQFDEAMRESELEEVRKAIHSVRDAPPLDLSASIDKPLMLPTPSKDSSAGAASAASPKPASKPKPKKRTKTVAGSAGRAKAAKPKASRGKKP